MTNGPKRSFYYYLMIGLSLVGMPFMFASLVILKQMYLADALFNDFSKTIPALATVMCEFVFIGEVFRHSTGYTVVTTTEYKLFKCLEKGKDEPFMMFADSSEELEQFFAITQPDKKFHIEDAEMNGKSIQMKIFNGMEQDEKEETNSD